VSDLDQLARLVDEAAIRRLALRYAQSVDRRDGAALAELFLPEARLDGSGVDVRGAAAIAAMPAAMARRYARTYHIVHNHLVELDGEEARGEVYSEAHHLTVEADGAASDYVLAITYADRYVRWNSGWRFAGRTLDIKWSRTDPVVAEVVLGRG
jgi:hypothetical protein